MGTWMNGYMDKLAAVRRENLEGGGPDRMALIHKLGKLTARERIDRLVDAGSFEELGSIVRDHRHPLDGTLRPSPGEGIVMGSATVYERPVMVYSFDFSVMSGSLGDQAAWKLADLMEMAGQRQMPIIGMIDSAGERLSIKGGDSGLNAVGALIKILPILGRCSKDCAAAWTLYRGFRLCAGTVRFFDYK